METISIHDVGFVPALTSITIAPRAIATYLAVRK
jgi:hypothetical protein